MRTIKFRAWYKHDNPPRMFNQVNEGGHTMRFVHYVHPDIHPLTYDFEVPFLDDDWIIEQFTGNYYKDGREAYEGDIFKCSSGCNHIIEYIQEHGGTYGGGMPSFYPSGLNNGYAWIGVEEYVGNIHDNPELLK